MLRDYISTFRSFEKPKHQVETLSTPINMLKTMTDDETMTLASKDTQEYKSIFHELLRCLQDATFPTDSVVSVEVLVMDVYKIMKEFNAKLDGFLDTEMYNLILETFAKYKSQNSFNIVILDMKEFQVPINDDTFKAMIKLAVNQRDYQKAIKLCTVMKQMGFNVDESVKSLIGENPFF